jgi:hypothetical protein
VCFFKGWPGAGPCDGALIRAHLLPRQLLKREFPQGVAFCDERGRWVDARGEFAYDDDKGLRMRSLRELCDDENAWIPCCGGPMGVSGHHGMLDTSRKLRIPREKVPVKVEAFAEALGLGWYIDRTYGERASAA